MDGSNGSGGAPQGSWQKYNDSQRKRWSAPHDRLKARTRALKDLFGGAPELSADMSGASPTDDPAGAEADLQKQLQNEERQRARSNAVQNLYGFGG